MVLRPAQAPPMPDGGVLAAGTSSSSGGPSPLAALQMAAEKRSRKRMMALKVPPAPHPRTCPVCPHR
jgi:hypothetical protein